MINEFISRNNSKAEYEDLIRRTYYRDGALFWAESSRKDLIGKQVGSRDKDGYIVTHISGKTLFIHRAIFYRSYGYAPAKIDHRDGDITNNEPENLRAADQSSNQMNQATEKKTASRVKGVNYHKTSGMYLPQLKVLGRRFSLGSFSDRFEAICARKSAEIKYHPEFHRNAARLNGLNK